EAGPGGLEPPAVAHSGRARRLAPAAAEAGVEMLDQGGIVGAELTPLEGAHQQDPAAGAVAFVGGREISRTGREAESAVDARVQRFEAAPVDGVSHRRSIRAAPAESRPDRTR